jgi:hypothetical protein
MARAQLNRKLKPVMAECTSGSSLLSDGDNICIDGVSAEGRRVCIALSETLDGCGKRWHLGACTPHFHVGHNTPGYLPESDVTMIDTASDAKACLISDLDYAGDYFMSSEDEETRALGDEYSAAMEDCNLANVADGYDVYLPSSTSEHDLGCHYWITACADSSHSCQRYTF